MAINNFIPHIWSANLLSTLKKAQVFANYANRDYQGDITDSGGSVTISQIGDITIFDYVPNVTTITPQELQDAASILFIDQKKGYAFKIDDVDAAQSKPKVMTEAMDKAAYSLSDTQDIYIAGLYASAGLSQNTNASPVDMTSLNVDDQFLACGETMDVAGISRQGRFAIIAPWVLTKLVLAGIASLSENVATFTNGYIGRAYGFDFSISPNVSKNSLSWDKTRNLLGSAKSSITVAEQIVKTESYRQTSEGFGDVVKGLHVYGAKIIRPDMTLVLYASKTAEA